MGTWNCWGTEVSWDHVHDGGEQETGIGSEGAKKKLFPGGVVRQPGLQLRTAFLLHSHLASAGRLILGLVLEALGQLPGSLCLSGLQGLEAQAPEG